MQEWTDDAIITLTQEKDHKGTNAIVRKFSLNNWQITNEVIIEAQETCFLKILNC